MQVRTLEMRHKVKTLNDDWQVFKTFFCQEI